MGLASAQNSWLALQWYLAHQKQLPLGPFGKKTSWVLKWSQEGMLLLISKKKLKTGLVGRNGVELFLLPKAWCRTKDGLET